MSPDPMRYAAARKDLPSVGNLLNDYKKLRPTKVDVKPQRE
jgi:hypothetical protein